MTTLSLFYVNNAVGNYREKQAHRFTSDKSVKTPESTRIEYELCDIIKSQKTASKHWPNNV